MIVPEINLNIADAYSALGPLALFAAGVAIYGILVFHFYRFLARKDILKLDLRNTIRPGVLFSERSLQSSSTSSRA